MHRREIETRGNDYAALHIAGLEILCKLHQCDGSLELVTVHPTRQKKRRPLAILDDRDGHRYRAIGRVIGRNGNPEVRDLFTFFIEIDVGGYPPAFEVDAGRTHVLLPS